MENTIKITIDGKVFETSPGKTILDVARANNITIPSLCYHPRTGVLNKCRACVVEIDGFKGLKESCGIPVQDGMVVKTTSEEIIEVRRMTVDFHLSNGEHNCLSCERNANCELQDMAYDLGIERPVFVNEETIVPIDDSSEGIIVDRNKCINCGRCVAACNDNVMHEVIDVGGRSIETKIIFNSDLPLGESTCVQCGECVQVCPVAALTFKNAKGKGQIWQLEKKETVCAYCGVGCKIDMYLKDNKWVYSMGTEREWEDQPNKGMLCVKGRFGFDFLDKEDRLKTPLIRKNGKLEPATWDEALDLVASKLTTIKEKHGPGAIGFFASARCNNEENYAMQRLARGVVGTNNMDHCARLCHSSTVAGLATTLGSGAMTNSMQEAHKSDVILITGANVTWAHPVFGGVIKRAVRKNGVKLIVVDPRSIDLAEIADVHLKQKPGTDTAWLMGLQHIIVKENWIDKAFIDERVEGWDEYVKSLDYFTPEKVEEITSIPKQDLYEAARLYATSGKGSIYYAMGITQHSKGVDNVRAIANLALITGNFGTEGTGVNPLRGQNNVQGACDMGALPNVFPGYQPVTDEQVREKFAKAWGIDPKSMDDKIGLPVTEMVNQAGDSIKAIYIMGENPMISDPNINHAREQFEKLDFMVVQDIFLTETAELADVVLPALAFAEKTGTYVNTERRVQISEKALNGPEGAKTDTFILAEVARRMGDASFPEDAAILHEEMRQITPAYHGITYKRLSETNGLRWPCPTEDHPGTPILHIGKFTRGKGLLTPIDWRPPSEIIDKEYPLWLTTGRLLEHYHTGSMTRKSKVLNGLVPNGKVEVNEEDAKEMGIKNGDMLKVTSRRGSITIEADVTDRVMGGVVFIPFHFAEAAANVLTNDTLDPVSKIPEFKVCAVKVEPAV